jgi:hypothetical protein
MKWYEQLEAAGFPTTVLVIDFESYYGDDLTLDTTKKGGVSIVEYVTHEDFELTGCGFGYMKPEHERFQPWFTPKEGLKEEMHGLKCAHGKDLEDVTVVAKNCKFDMLILAVKFGIYPKYTLDCDDLTRTFDSRMKKGMKDAAPVFGIGIKGETAQFKNLHYQQIVDGGLLPALEEYTLNDIDIEQQWIEKLLPIMDNPHIELPLAAHTLQLYTRPRLSFDFQLCDKLIADMQEEIEKSLRDITPWVLLNSGFDQDDVDLAFECDAWVDLVQDIIGKDLRFVPLLIQALPDGQSVPTKVGKPGKNMKLLLKSEDQIPALAKNDDGCKWLIAHSDPTVSALMAARQALNSWPGHIKRLTNMRNQSKASGGRFRIPLKYHGAHTARWSGEQKVNTANLGGTGRGQAIAKSISQVRHTIIAPMGCSLALVDAAQIEARNLAWYAEQDDLLDLFRVGGDPYADLATDIFQCNVWKWQDGDTEEYPGQKGKVKIYRGFGKDAILGCGYGMGWMKFLTNCLQNDFLRPMFDSGEYDEEFIRALIKTYRTKYSRIPGFWRGVEKAWRKATMFKCDVEYGRLIFYHHAGTTYIILPSGRRLRYRNARVNRKGELKHRHGTLWGGSITENIVQATCRDFLAEWILELEREHNRRVVHHVYDEIIVVDSRKTIEDTMGLMIDVMSRGPEWADGMPFAAEGQVCDHYTK